MELNKEQLKRIFHLGDEYGPDFIGLHSIDFEVDPLDSNRFIMYIRVVVIDIDDGWKPIALRTRKITIDEQGEIFDQEYYDEPYVAKEK